MALKASLTVSPSRLVSGGNKFRKHDGIIERRSDEDDPDFIHGRDANVIPAVNVYESIDPESAPVLPDARRYDWDIGFDW
ncbi:MAG: hypothetical protein AB2598_02390 [Candidatus Thiodiazotropha sp.]